MATAGTTRTETPGRPPVPADIYALAPLQQGLLFESLSAPDGSAYFNRFSCTLRGALDVEALRRAWQHLAERHAVLRTSFHWEGLANPVQVVHAQVELPWAFEDWRGRDPDEEARDWEGRLAEDRRLGFRLDRAPLLRLRLRRTGEDRYRFGWSHHHLLLDGWCLPLLLDELVRAYAALRAGRAPELPPVRPYRDFIAWLQARPREADGDYWREALRGFRQPTPLGFERETAEPAGAALDLAESESYLEAPLASGLRRLAESQRLTPSVLVQGAWALLLGRYSGESDVLFGTTVSGRPAELAGAESMVGVFINTLPARVELPADMPLLPWLQRLQRQQAERAQHAWSALSEVQRRSDVPAGTPLFESLLLFQNYPAVEALPRWPDLEVGDVRLWDQARAPLALQVTPGARWHVQSVWDRRRFDADDLARLHGHLETLLLGFVRDPARPLREFEILTARERHQLLVEFAGPVRPFDARDGVVQRLERRARETPERPAVECGATRRSFAELNARANRLARALLRRVALAPDDRVALLASRSTHMLEAILAVWKCGCAYVPVEPRYPAARIRAMLELSGAPLVLADAAALAAAGDVLPPAVTALTFEELRDELAQGDASDLGRAASPGDLAYVIFTSGSTGTPKGAMVEQVGMLNHLLAKLHDLDLGPDARIVQNASHCFDVSVWQFLAAPLAGGTTLIYPDDVVLDARRFCERLRADAPTVVEVVPSYLRALLDEAERVDLRLPALRHMLVTGEEVKPALVRAWFSRYPGLPLVNAYGPTEASDDITHAFLERAPDGPSVPIGRPLQNFRIYVVDRLGRLCPRGVKGEIWVSGVGVGRGYLGDPERTRAVFFDDPFSEGPGVRLYRTGDLGRYLPDGSLLYHGREDAQVKLRGQRIELGEIERAIASLPGVRDAAVRKCVREGREFLCAWVAPAAGAALAPEGLQAGLAERLPAAMVPAAFVLLDELPLNANGKVDRARLPEPPERPAGTVARRPPKGAVETRLAALWQEVLGGEPPGLDDDFFALGGDSILSMRLVSLAARHGLRLSPRQVFQHPTLAELARVAESLAEAEAAMPAGPEPAAEDLPLTPIQRRFLARYEDDSPQHHNQAVLLEVPAALDADVLRAALQHVVAAHAALRLRFGRGPHGWTQSLAAPDAPVPLTLADLAGAADDALAAQVEALHAGLDLERGPLFRAGLFRRGASEPALLLLVAHHLAVDAVSWPIVAGDLHAACEELARGAVPVAVPAGVTWRAWCDKLAAHARSEELAGELAEWLRPARAAVAPLPRDHDITPEADTVAAQVEFTTELDPEASAALLRELPAAYNGKSDDALLAALALALMRWSGGHSALIDVETHGREGLFPELDLGRTVGWFTAQFPLLVELERGAESGPREALVAVKETLRRLPARGTGYGLLRFGAAGPGPAAELARLPAPEISFNFVGRVEAGATGAAWRLAGESSGAGRPPGQRREHPLTLDAWVSDGRLHVTWTHGPAHETRSVRRLADDFQAALLRLVAHFRAPQARTFTPSDFPLAGLEPTALDDLVARVALAGPGAVGTPADVYPLTPMQQGMLFHGLFAPGAEVYRNAVSARIDGELDAGLFRRAWQSAVARHAALRTSFHWQDLAEPLQVVHQAAELPWEEHDWSGLVPDEQERRWSELVAREQAHVFDLERPPLLRVSLARLGPRQARLHTLQHHLLLDGWSAAGVLRDVFAAYEALVAGREFDPPAPRPFRDHVAWLRRQDAAAGEAYWRRELSGVEAPTPLPLGRPEIEGRATAGAMAEREERLDAGLSAALTALAQRARVTLNVLVQAAWSLLLARLSGQADVVHGSVVSGRPAELVGSETMIGVFINTVPVRARVPRDTPLVAWLGELHAAQAERESASHFPLVEIQGWSQVPAGTPLCSSLLIFENYPVDDSLIEACGALRVQDVQAREPNSFPLTLVATPGRELLLKAMFDAGRFDHDTIARLLGQYRLLLEQFARAPEQPLGRFEVLDETQRRRLLHDWNDTARPLPEARSALDLFRRQAAARPEATAVAHAGARLTYAELDRRSTALARRLRAAAAPGRDARVALLLPRGESVPLAILATWKCGAAYVPIEPTQPPARVARILAEARPCALVTSASARAGLEFDPGLPIVAVDADAPDDAAGGDFTGPEPRDLAYVLFTSGSTGTPKGVMIEHRGLLNHVLAMASAAALDATSVVAQTAPYVFDISVWQMFAPLVCGGATVIYGADEVLRPRALLESLDRDGVQVVQWVPSYLAAVLDEAGPSPVRPRALRLLSTIGEALKPALARRWFEAFPGVPLLNAYGPTEASDSVTHERLSGPPQGSVAIGRPIANLRVYVLDDELRPCPPGVKGEICIAGLGVGRGYLFDDERTRAVFADDPFRPGSGERLYHSGDLGCWSDDGRLHFFGRRDHQVKLRGQRLELGEIESALAEIEGVSEAVALLRQDAAGDASLCAYVVPEPGRPFEPETALSGLRERLPAALLPDHVLCLPAWPRTANGKIDRRALPAPAQAQGARRAEPQSPTERALAAAFEEVLGRRDFDLDDSFFALGGHSLKAIRLAAHVHRTLGLALDLADVFRFESVRALAARLDSDPRAAAAPLPLAPPAEAYPASHAQRRVWLASRTRAGSLAHTITAGLALRGGLDAERLERALRAVVARHESLRTAFDGAGGELVQRVRPAAEWGGLERHALAPGRDWREAARELLHAQAETPFDLARGPLLRAVLLRAGERQHVLLLALHHVAADVWSLDVLWREVGALYAGFGRGEDEPLPPLALQHKDYAVWERAQEDSDGWAAARAYWLAQLADAPPAVSAGDGGAPDAATVPLGSQELLLDASRARDLERLAAGRRASPQALLLAAVAALLHRSTGAEDVVIGTQTAGRAHPDLHGQVGCFVNTLPLRLRPRGAATLGALADEAQAALAAARGHEHYPFDRLLDDLAARRAVPGPLFDVQLDYLRELRADGGAAGLSGLEVEELQAGPARSPWGLGFLVSEHASGLRVHLAHARARLGDDGARRLLGRLERVLSALLDAPDTTLAAIDLAASAPAGGEVRVELDL